MIENPSIASPHGRATEEGRRMLARGGSAADAAIAAAAVLAVVYPHMVSLGGDAWALLSSSDGQVVAVNGSGRYPRGALPADVSGRNAGQMPTYGVDAITVPGGVAAWQDIHRRSGRLKWSELFTGAIELAHDGMEISGALYRDLDNLKAELVKDFGLRSLFFDALGAPFPVGHVVRQTALAASMTQIAENGAEAFYDGPVGARLIEGLASRGSSLTLDDLREHYTEFVSPISRTYRGTEVVTTPPNSQGFVLLQILGVLAEMKIEQPIGVERAREIAHLMAASNSEREVHLADPAAVAVDLDELLSHEHISGMLRQIEGPGVPGVEHGGHPTGDTIAIVAIDDSGESISLIQSIFFAFGSRILEPSTGILLHNRGASFTLEAGHAATLLPGARPPHTLMPVMLRTEGQVIGVLGTMGGPSQAQIQAQLIQRLVNGESPQDVVSQPRWVVGRYDGVHENVVLAEARCSQQLRSDLASAGLPMVIGKEWDDRVGHSQVIMRRGSTVQVGTDPRADAGAR